MSLPLKEDGDSLVFNPGFGRYLEGCKVAVRFLNGLPEVESLTVYTDADGVRWMKKCMKALRSLTTAKLVISARDGSCGHKS